MDGETDERVLALLAEREDATGRLPPERSIAAELGLTRAAVRKTLDRLQAEGRILRQVGRGTFLRRDGPESAIDDIKRRTSPREAMQARLLIEPDLAGLAAVNATVEQIGSLRALTATMRRVEDWSDYELLDGRFHREIAEAAGNKLLLSVHDLVNEVRRAVIWAWLDTRPAGPAADYSSFAEHEAILDAITRRDRQGAAEAMRAHLRTTSLKLIGTD
jgi:DNA-binding FadR family transcriptional regulator